MPCNVKLSALYEEVKDDRIDPQCVNDLDQIIEYLGPINFLILTNEESFVQD